MSGWEEFTGLNRGYVLALYEKYRNDPGSVDDETRAVFDTWAPPAEEAAAPAAGTLPVRKIVGAVNLAQSIRRYGHLAAQLDPLGNPPAGDPALLPETHGVTEEDLRTLPASLVFSPLCAGASNMLEAIDAFRRIYCSTTGYDYAHVFVPEERQWLRNAAECGRFRAPSDPIDPIALLDRLTEVEAFERFLQRTFPGKTRFSIEGLDMLVPILDEVIGEAAESGSHHILIGMAHRGRLNVMAHVLNKPYGEILAEFKDAVSSRSFREDMAWTGDVKYHAGAHRAIAGGAEMDLVVSMPPNPSHLEAVNPIVEGMARAAGTSADTPGAPSFDATISVPILIHGDAAFPGQGIVAETLNLGRLPGYSTGGTIHIIVNNQLGFTTGPEDAYSTSYASGLARGFKIPIVHVNADDPEACVEAARLAFAYRARFQRDFLIDLIGYRRHGHNEGDEPAFTQPLMYQKISSHPTVREVWAHTLVQRGLVTSDAVTAMNRQRMDELQAALDALKPEEAAPEPEPAQPPAGAAARTETAVALDRLRDLNQGLLSVPDGFTMHRKRERGREKRGHAFDAPGERTIDWALAEELAIASILADGVSVRLTGEDVERGTFSHRHAVSHDVKTGQVHVPLQTLPQSRAAFEIHNSPLTENAVVGFEYGYNIQQPSRLVIWEAQYGDFINGAQVMIDEFLVSARGKWGLRPSLVLLLPHAHEGQGPDHASARPERFLQLAADLNMRIANCTTSAQYFHLLRRQAALLEIDPLPLIVLTPKSLLRHPLVASAPQELAEGRFRMVIPDEDARPRAGEVRRVLVCSGKVYTDLVAGEQRPARNDVAICRLEQLYPVATRDLRAALDLYPNAAEIVWVQEEPENMGAWDFVRPYLQEAAGKRAVGRVARPRSASPAEGSAARHAINQQALVDQAFGEAPARGGDVEKKGRRDAALTSAKG
ncbi:MAG: 2-oxoglutarate dehydrogenase E1 component [Acidobacteria bacterium RIFCSPLOWO2_02_FULL_67_36]|nr:MAG: 2-oxoglutarate dehydrogenase E1 component [Acidobacteria bacterium RIFCSPLOWO2_02_FULL_67_36]OFW24439.1 MAG: 2-oxoglutarate dehydrogenase E1 component [Acidobacteria bacterium RIFCSPLOWO2_12_FULL_66_21]